MLAALLLSSFVLAEGPILYNVSGVHSVYGPYQGQVELRPEKGGLSATRVIEYQDYSFDEYRVQEVWTGSALESDGTTQLQFSLRQADFLRFVDGVERTSDQFQTPVKVTYNLDVKAPAEFSIGSSVIRETVVNSAVATTDPLWRDERIFIPTLGDSLPWLSNAAFLTLLKPFLERYHADPMVSASLARPECQSQEQQVVRDTTDFQFLRKHPNTLRVVNKVTDRIALVESRFRTDAYAPTLAAKAKAFDDAFPAQNLNAFGSYVWNGEHGQFSNGDSALFTGMYAGSQAMRWFITHDSQALDNFRRALNGLILDMDVTGDPTTFARSVEPMQPGEKLDPGWYQGPAGSKYHMPGNNDMVKGIFYAFAWAFELLPDGDPTLEQVKMHARRLPGLQSLQQAPLLTENSFLADGLAALAGSRWDLVKFVANYALKVGPVDATGVEDGYYYGGIADWSGANLNVLTGIARILIAKDIDQRLHTLGVAHQILTNARYKLLETWSVYEGSKRDSLTVAAYTFGANNNLGLTGSTQSSSWSKIDKWPQSVQDSLWSLYEMPVDSSAHEVMADHNLRPDWCMSQWPDSVWQSFGSSKPMSYFYQNKALYPWFESAALGAENVWSSGWALNDANLHHARAGRFDYLHMYWMARVAGLISAQE